MRSVKPIKAAKISYIAVSCLLCVLGIVLMALPEVSATVLGIVCGIVFIAFGIAKLLGYFSRDLYRLAFQYDLAFGILQIALGIMMILSPRSLILFICIALGLFILADGLCKIQIAFESKRFGLRFWWLIFIFAIIAGAFGLVLMLRPGEGSRFLVIWFGLSLLWEGILNLCTVITAVKIIRNQMPEVKEFIESEE